MNRLVRVSTEVVVRFWPLIVAQGIGESIASYGIWRQLAVPMFILPIVMFTVAVVIVLYGRIVASVLPGQSSDRWAILQKYGLCYLVAMLAIGTPELLFKVLARQSNMAGSTFWAISGSIHAAMSLLTIYSLPIVFLKRAHVPAVLAGVGFLMAHIWQSRWILGVVVLALVIHGGGVIAIWKWPSAQTYILVTSIGVLTAILHSVSFLSATRVLLGVPSERSGVST